MCLNTVRSCKIYETESIPNNHKKIQNNQIGHLASVFFKTQVNSGANQGVIWPSKTRSTILMLSWISKTFLNLLTISCSIYKLKIHVNK